MEKCEETGQNYLEYWEEHIIRTHESTEEWEEQKTKSFNSLQKSDDENVNESDFLYEMEMEFIEKENAKRQTLKKTKPDKEPLRIELDKYHSIPRDDLGKEDPLQWWAKNEDKLPLLAKMARKYLSVPVTSATSERMFSTGGNIMTDNRHNLEPETTSKLLFINRNYLRVKSDFKKWDKSPTEDDEPDLPKKTNAPSTKRKEVPRSPTSSSTSQSTTQSPPKKKTKKSDDANKKRKPVDDYSASKSLIDDDFESESESSERQTQKMTEKDYQNMSLGEGT